MRDIIYTCIGYLFLVIVIASMIAISNKPHEGKAYQEHGYSRTLTGNSGNVFYKIYRPVVLSQRVIDSLNNVTLNDSLK